ncbi:MAG TPA: hypothetical protein DET40_11250 [Lentisphaeria bacterium]|nr:MAG: hypothetical protein A2X45_19940 [Lentisphaerae bacterium GWF2_50_93]HCE44115.1 hypothetical protein [Lentisphaeria bacterium]
MEIHKDFKEFIELFNSHGVEYVIVGGYALAFLGAPRYTGDLDLFIKPDRENALKILSALKSFGFGSLKLNESDFSEPDNVIQLGVPPVRIDIVTSITGVEWTEVEKNKVESSLDGHKVFFISKKDFIRNKKAVSRHKDLADIEALGSKVK